MKRPVTAFALLLAAATVACLDNDITGTRPLSFSLTSDVASATVGDSITFSFSATGTSIFGVLLFYGDGVVDTLATESPNTVEWTQAIKHAYEVPGDFAVIGRLETSVGTRTDTVAVVIAPEGS
jgi:hypothetical protein